MNYNHTGTFDWRTSRYRTYARVYVPLGSELVSTEGDLRTDRSTERGRIDTGTAHGKTWFGTFTSIEPGEIGALSFSYYLPASIDATNYQLLVETQAGVEPIDLSLDLDFAGKLKDAEPAEARDLWGDAAYEYDTILRTDQSFSITI